MANFQIPLNGSNFINKDRQQKFLDALNDDHKVECTDERQLTVADPGQSQESLPPDTRLPAANHPGLSQGNGSNGIDKVLEHSFTHQTRTMDIHQQFLAQQAEYMQLITAVLNQQGKVLDSGNSAQNAAIIETFQRTLDKFHAIREQALMVHQAFLAKQADFSDRFLSALEAGERPRLKPAEAPSPALHQSKAPEWVVKEPHIILDEQAPEPIRPAAGILAEKPAGSAPAVEPAPAAGITSAELSGALLRIVSEKTGYPPEMLELNMDLEADLGIDSIKRVEILGALEEEFPALPPADTEVLSQTRTLQEIVSYMESETAGTGNARADQLQITEQPAAAEEVPAPELPRQPQAEVSGPSSTAADLTAILLEIVAEKTGYPVEMLDSGMDMEADLGIDSIKRVEILGAMEERVPGLPTVESETLANLRTLGQIVELMQSSPNHSEPPAPDQAADKKKAQESTLDKTPIKLRSLPIPDKLEFNIPQDQPLIVSNEGGELTAEVASFLQEQGWKVVIWDYPGSLVSPQKQSLPKGLAVAAQAESGKDSILAALTGLRTEHGLPIGFIHLHPQANGKSLFDPAEEDLIKQVFLMAGALKDDLTRQDPDTRKLFLTVTRMDGALGINNHGTFQEGSGLTGLVKTLNWEWPEVFCRAVDLNQEIKPQDASRLLLQEIQDPDRGIQEVGLSQTSRVTIERDRGN